MKLNRIIIAGVALVLAASCSGLNELPKFAATDAFAAFNKSAMAASEDAGRVQIPVTIGALEAIATTVTYEIDSTSTAQAGVHFNLVDPSAVLTFADGALTAYIELDLIPIHGEAGYTGDKKVIINLLSSNDVKIGGERVCEFTINDQDHPLAAILGAYTLNGSATVTMVKDPQDITVVHFPDLMSGTKTWLGPSYSFDIIGQVSSDMSTIVISLPIDTGYTYSNGENLKIYAQDGDSVFFDVSSITLTKTATGYACEEYGLISYIKNAGYVEYYDPPFTLVKK